MPLWSRRADRGACSTKMPPLRSHKRRRVACQHFPDDQTLRLQAGDGEDDAIHLPSDLDRVDCKRQEEEDLTQPQYTDTRPTSPSADPITPGAWQSSHWSTAVYKSGVRLHLGKKIMARMHHKVVGNFRSEADVRSLYFRGFRFNQTSDNGACTHGQSAK